MSRPLLNRTSVWVRVRPGAALVRKSEWTGQRDADAGRVRALPVTRQRKNRRRAARAA